MKTKRVRRMKNKIGKKGVLFTITTIVLLLALFSLSHSFLVRSRSLSHLLGSGFGEKLLFIHDDVLSNSYRMLLDIIVEGVERNSTAILKFDHIFLSSQRDYDAYMQNYESLVEGTYASLNNIDLSLEGFNSSFSILPYNTTFDYEEENLSVYTMPAAEHIESITAYISINGTFDCSGLACPGQEESQENGCQGPGNTAGNPVIFITWQDSNSFTCTQAKELSPTENNDKGNGKQFAANLLSGNAEVKYGTVLGRDGVFKLIASGIESNLTQLDIEYRLAPEKIMLKGGVLGISSDAAKRSHLVLYQEP